MGGRGEVEHLMDMVRTDDVRHVDDIDGVVAALVADATRPR